jgi:hypothetical protein
MNSMVLDYLPAYVLGGCVATVAAVLIGLHRGLKGAGWPDDDRKTGIRSIAALLIVWFFAELGPAWLGLYRGTTSGIPMIQYGMLIPLVVAIVLFWRWRLLRRIIEAVPQTWIVGIQFYRVLGVIFLVLYAAGRLPGAFAQPAGIGDIVIGLLAPIVGIAYARRPQVMAGWLRAWNLFGIGDLIVAVTTAFLTSPSPMQMLAFAKPNELISAFPLVMIPVFLVPLAVLLHLASLKKLSRAESSQVTRRVDGSRRNSPLKPKQGLNGPSAW